MINKYTDPIITNYRFDKVGSRASVPITESLTVNNGFLFLKEIPDRNNVVNIGELVEVQKPEELDSEKKFYVDYNAGIVYFDSKLNGTKVNVEYSGIGIVYYPASRIYLEADENHEIIRTLSDIEGQLSSLSNLKNQQERLKQEIEERNGDLNKTIEEAKTINLSGSVEKAKQAKTDLEGTTRKANIADANLRTDIEFAKGVKIDLKKQEEQSKTEIQKSVNLADTTKTSLDNSIISADDKINKANEKVNEINSKITEANTTEQKLTTTKNEITTSLSDYDKKSAEIKTSIVEVDSKKAEIEDSIGRANTSNDTLNASIKKSEESIKNANDISTNIDSSIAKYKETESSIKAENEKATKNISDLDTKSASGKQVIDHLNSAILKSETTKTNLDESNTKAIQTNTDLKTTTQTANEAKTSLEQLKNESSTLSNELSESNTTASSNIETLKSENQNAKTNIAGLQTENQNALSKQEILSSETEKANEAIAKIAELITSSTDLKNKFEQIVASGDLDKYITDPKLREILTDYVTKDDLSKIDLTEELKEYAKIVDVSELGNIAFYGLIDKPIFKIFQNVLDSSGDLTNTIEVMDDKLRELLDAGKIVYIYQAGEFSYNENYSNKFNGHYGYLLKGRSVIGEINRPSEKYFLYVSDIKNKDLGYTQHSVSLNTLDSYNRQIQEEFQELEESKVDKVQGYGLSKNDYSDEEKAKVDSIESGANKTTSLSQLTNDTNFKTEAEIQQMIDDRNSLSVEVVDTLPTTGKDKVIYLVKDTIGSGDNNHLEYLWINGKWELIGSTQVDLSGYATKSEVERISSKQTTQTSRIASNQQNIQSLQNDVKNKLSKSDVVTILSPSARGGVYSTGVVNQIQSDLMMNFQVSQQELGNEIDKKLDKSDLSPFTQQELEEAFK